jgi:hypothetical protein
MIGDRAVIYFRHVTGKKNALIEVAGICKIHCTVYA